MKIAPNVAPTGPDAGDAGSPTRAVTLDEIRNAGQNFGSVIDQLASMTLRQGSKQRILEAAIIDPLRRKSLPLTDRNTTPETVPFIEPIALRSPFATEYSMPAGKTTGAFKTPIGGQSEG